MNPNENVVQVSGSLSTVNTFNISGALSIPVSVDHTAIHYDTTEGWNDLGDFVTSEGHIYIYDDYETIDNGDGTVTYVPALKVGDGVSYLSDLPFTTNGSSRVLTEHINNETIHVTAADKAKWNQNVSISYDAEDENLILSWG